MKFFRKVDDFITMWLTVLVWWVDVRFHKDNTWCAHISFTCIPAIFFFFMAPWTKVIEKGIFLEQVVWSLLLSLIIYGTHIFFWWFIFELESTPTANIIKQAKKSPNPNRYTTPVKTMKFCFLIATLTFGVKYQNMYEAFLFFGHIMAIYLLCVDNIPPAEKRKRMEAREMKNMVPVSTM